MAELRCGRSLTIPNFHMGWAAEASRTLWHLASTRYRFRMQAFEHLRLSTGESKKVLSLTVRISRHGKIRKSAGRTRAARLRRVGA